MHPNEPAADSHLQLQQMLTFLVGGEHYAVDLLQVQEIRSFEAPTRLANSAPALRGFLDLRGTIVTVLDLRTVLGADEALGASTATVILNVAGRTFGLVVDAVDEVANLYAAQIQRPPQLGVATRVVRGLVTVPASPGNAQRTLQLLDVQVLMSAFAPASLEAA